MARSFNGSTDVIKTSSPISTATGTLTLSVWFNRTTTTTGYQAIFFNGNAGSNGYGFNASNNGDGKFCYLIAGVAFGTAITFTNNVWHHGALTIGGPNTCTLYLDGSLVDGPTSQPSVHTPTNNTFFGSSFDGTNNYPGLIADGAMWTAILTTAEISALAKGARPKDIRPGSLVFWAPLDGLQSPEPDLSGNAKNGTLTGTALAAGPPFMPFTPRWPQFPIQAIPAQVFTLMPQICL